MNKDKLDFLTLDDITQKEVSDILESAQNYKDKDAGGKDLESQTLGMIFQKPSTRTRVSFETGMTQLGGHAVYLNEEDIHLGRGEPLKDTARAVSSYVDILMARTYRHGDIETLAEYSETPVVNGLSDKAHPCQALADLLTIKEKFGGFEDVKAAWIGDCNNVAHSFALGCSLTGLKFSVAAPENQGFNKQFLEKLRENGLEPEIAEKPEEAVKDSDVVYTDVWNSMGDQKTSEELEKFEDYQVNQKLLEKSPGAFVMHCLPAKRGEEITEEVLEGSKSVVWQQAENRLHVQKALLNWLLEDN